MPRSQVIVKTVAKGRRAKALAGNGEKHYQPQGRDEFNKNRPPDVETDGERIEITLTLVNTAQAIRAILFFQGTILVDGH